MSNVWTIIFPVMLYSWMRKRSIFLCCWFCKLQPFNICRWKLLNICVLKPSEPCVSFRQWTLHSLGIDYRYEKGRLRCSLDPNLYPSSETYGLILKQEAEKSTQPYELNVGKPLVVSISQRSEYLRLCTTWVEFDNFKPRLKAVRSNASG
jgi:hypothetical protein